MKHSTDNQINTETLLTTHLLLEVRVLRIQQMLAYKRAGWGILGCSYERVGRGIAVRVYTGRCRKIHEKTDESRIMRANESIRIRQFNFRVS